VDGKRMEWEAKDLFVVPGWASHEHVNMSSSHPAYLFSFTDGPVMKALGLYRES
jgi:gentisate 1,2-dioxygenase